MQVYTYLLRPLGRPHHRSSEDNASLAPAGAAIGGSSDLSIADEVAANNLMRASAAVRRKTSGGGGAGSSTDVTGYELQLVMEHCPLVSVITEE